MGKFIFRFVFLVVTFLAFFVYFVAREVSQINWVLLGLGSVLFGFGVSGIWGMMDHI